MVSISEIDAKGANKSCRNENQPVDITVRIGIFFDGTNNKRAQVMKGRLARQKKGGTSKKENDEILSTMNMDKLDIIERLYIDNSEDKVHYHKGSDTLCAFMWEGTISVLDDGQYDERTHWGQKKKEF